VAGGASPRVARDRVGVPLAPAVPALVVVVSRPAAALALATALATGTSSCGGHTAGPASVSSGGAGDDASLEDARPPDAADAEAEDAGADVGSCSSPRDCPFHEGPQIYCCTDNVCAADLPDACADGSERPIRASNYDQSCATDTDCVAITEGNACSLIGPCPTGAINKGSYARYQADTAGLPCFSISSCPVHAGPCCRAGSCQMNAGCSSPSDTLAACADAGGACVPFAGQCGGKGAGPPRLLRLPR
jgi:hypothetical protein